VALPARASPTPVPASLLSLVAVMVMCGRDAEGEVTKRTGGIGSLSGTMEGKGAGDSGTVGEGLWGAHPSKPLISAPNSVPYR
jgi:hypothetical protein